MFAVKLQNDKRPHIVYILLVFLTKSSTGVVVNLQHLNATNICMSTDKQCAVISVIRDNAA